MEKVRDIRERTFKFACDIIRLHRAIGYRRGVDRMILSQLLRSGTSIGANLEEAQGGQSKADFVTKCRIALKEARESHYWLRLLEATQEEPAKDISYLATESGELVAILTAIVKKAAMTKSRRELGSDLPSTF
jgi:four helix bundle protein